MRRWWAVGFLALVACGGGGSISAATQGTTTTTHAPQSHLVSGQLTLYPGRAVPLGTSCSGDGGYSDISGGAQITVKDGAGALLAVGTLEAGVGVNAGSQGACRFRIRVVGVPEVPFYQFEIGHRGALAYSLDDMRGKGWAIDITLGRS